jgi:hypothetical protein
MSAKLVLDIAAMQEDFFADSALIGIATALPGYGLCWQINRYFGFNFIREAELDICLQKGIDNKRYFSIYQYCVPMSGSRHVIYKLKSEKDALLPEAKQLDYLWLVQSSTPELDAYQYMQYLRQMPEIQLAQVLAPERLKNINNLLL